MNTESTIVDERARPPEGTITEELDLAPSVRLSRELLQRARQLTTGDVRYLVGLYYEFQEYRIRAAGQLRAREQEMAEDNPIIFIADDFQRQESNIKLLLTAYARQNAVCQWAMQIKGIGPVLASGLVAEIDINKAPTVGHIWRFAGLDPTVKWDKGQKRPWNADLKVLCWKIGESFVKVSNYDDDIYGHIYAERKVQEIAANDRGEFAEQAKAMLERKKFGADTMARASYELGKLPPAHIHARAKRYAVKLFLSHLHHVMYEMEFGEAPPKPYIFSKPEHTHYLEPPFWH